MDPDQTAPTGAVWSGSTLFIYDASYSFVDETRNVSMGHGCPRYCQIRINRALSLTKGHNSNNNLWILSLIELDLYSMIIYLCMKYESNTPMYSKDIARKPFFIRRSRAITLIIIGGFYPLLNLTCILWLYTCMWNMIPIHQCIQKISPGNHFSYLDQGP